MSDILHIDFETRSAVELKTAGIGVYAADPSTDVWCMAFMFGDGDMNLWKMGSPVGLGTKHVWRHVQHDGIVMAHNAQFEYMIWNEIMAKRYGWPPLRLEQMRCTMAMAYAMSLPGSLDNASVAMGLDQRKDAEGYRIMLQLAKPRSVDVLGNITWWDDPAKLERLYAYCKQDVIVERELGKLLTPLSDQEQALWELDQRINQRGVAFDRSAVVAAKSIADAEKNRCDGRMRSLTGNYVGTCNSHAALAQWIRDQGVPIEGVAKPEVLDALSDEGLPEIVRSALLIRQEAARSSTAKLKAMLSAASDDDRIRFMFQYHGAGTGRWTGRRVQLHNLPRPKLKHHVVEECLGVMKQGCRDYLEMMYGPPLDIISSCLRGMLVAGPGKDLLAADFANIEGRVLAWLAGEGWKVQAFRDFDAGTGPDIYRLTYARSFNVEVGMVTDEQRQVGKVEELALGYQGWVGAFQTMARGYGVEISDERAAEIAGAWRRVHPKIRAYWGDLEEAAVDAVRSPGLRCGVGLATFLRDGNFLWLCLPSGRVLCYPYPQIFLKTREFDNGSVQEKEAVRYMGEDSVTHKWDWVDTYGGLWAENITQAVARDVLAEAMTRLDGYGAQIVLHVHDEVVIEVSETSILTVPVYNNIVAQSLEWAAGLPIAVAGWRGKRYRK
jgi:DNA polymerase